MTLTHTAQLLARSTRAVLIAVFWAGLLLVSFLQFLAVWCDNVDWSYINQEKIMETYNEAIKAQEKPVTNTGWTRMVW